MPLACMTRPRSSNGRSLVNVYCVELLAPLFQACHVLSDHVEVNRGGGLRHSNELEKFGPVEVYPLSRVDRLDDVGKIAVPAATDAKADIGGFPVLNIALKGCLTAPNAEVERASKFGFPPSPT